MASKHKKPAKLMKDDNAVTFINFRCGLSVENGISVFDKGEFIFDQTNYTVSGKKHVIINGLIIYCDNPSISKIDPSDMNHTNDLNCYLRQTYFLAEEIITAIAGKYHTFAFFGKPITCFFRGEEYSLDDASFSKKGTHVFRFPKANTTDLSFLNTSKHPRKYFHLYRLANDPTLPMDQRILMAWRFLECYFKLRDGVLIDHLTSTPFINKDGVSQKFRNDRIKRFYGSYRSAVAHATRSSNTNHSKKIIYPRAVETNFSLTSRQQLRGILDAIDLVLTNDKRTY